MIFWNSYQYYVILLTIFTTCLLLRFIGNNCNEIKKKTLSFYFTFIDVLNLKKILSCYCVY